MSQSSERFEGKPRTADDELLDAWIRHAHFVERWSAGEVKRTQRMLREEVLSEVAARLTARLSRIGSRGYDSGVDGTKQWASMLESIEAIVDDGIAVARKASIASLKDLSQYEAAWQAKALDRVASKALGVSFATPSPQVLRDLVTDRPIAGFNVGDWWDKLSIDTTARIEREVRIGLAEGQAVPDIASRVTGSYALRGTDGAFEITARHAQAIVRNAAVHTSNHARLEVFSANPGVISEVEWVATLDGRTCPICGSRDGKVYPVGEGPVPPAHPPGPNGGACRCGLVPHIRGLRGQRASKGGPVSTSVTYSRWLSEQSPEMLREALGAKRAVAFARGDLALDRMVDQSGRVLTLEQISEREGISF